MTARSFQVTFYELTLGSKVIVTVQNAPVPCHALISCKGAATEQFDIFVVADSQNRPNTCQFTDQRTSGRMFVPLDELAWYLDLLRNEKLIAYLDDVNPHMNRLTCASPAAWGHIPE